LNYDSMADNVAVEAVVEIWAAENHNS
jgi:hypothetical protein